MLEESLRLAIRHYSETDSQSLTDDLKSALKLLKKHTTNRARGTRQGSCRLTESQVLHIRKSTESHAALARKYKVGTTTIWKVRNRETWGHLP